MENALISSLRSHIITHIHISAYYIILETKFNHRNYVTKLHNGNPISTLNICTSIKSDENEAQTIIGHIITSVAESHTEDESRYSVVTKQCSLTLSITTKLK